MIPSRAILASFLIVAALCTAARAQTEPDEATTLSSDFATTQSLPELDTDQQADVRTEAADSINGNLKDASEQRAGVFKYGPVTLIDPYWLKFTNLLDKYGIRLGIAYTMVFQTTNGANTSVPAALGGDLDIFGNWRALGKPDGSQNGYLDYYFEQRSSVGTSIPPKLIGNDIGSLWGTTNGFNDEPFIVKELYWEQHFWDNGLIIRAGKLDPTNYYDTNRWQSDSRYFMNQAFSSFPVRSFPSPGVGLNLKLQFADWLTISTGIQNAQGNANTGNLGDLWDDYSPFTAAEIDYTPNIRDFGRGNYRFTYWYRDATGSTGLPHDGGFDLSFDQQWGPNFTPFFRYGYSEATISHISNMISAGLGYRGKILSPDDIVGGAFSWGQPSTPGLRSQYATEIFYRLQASPDVQCTIGYQLIIDPSNNPGENVVGVFELRWRIAL
jgi:porin